jgi:type IV pilus assembly protein PilP
VRLRALAIFIGVALAGCSGQQSELQQWMRDTEKSLPRKIDPLPQIKPFTPFTYEGFDVQDPFVPRKLASTDKQPFKSVQNDPNRRKEPLEAFSLEQIKMVGTLQQAKEVYALVRAEKTLYRVRKGNYMGQNFGLITDINEGEVKLKEVVQDSAGDWSERITTIQLLEEGTKK